MASKTIKGLTVEIGGDTTKLGKALDSVESKSRDLSSELGEINKLLKFDPDNADLLAQKQKVLADAVANTSKKLDTLKEAEKQVQKQFERGEASEEQVRALQREIIATEKKLGSYKNAAKETAEAIDKLGDESDDAAKEVEEVADAADDAADAGESLGAKLGNAAKTGFAAVTAAATALIGALVGCAEETREYRTEMGKLDTAFTTAGHTSEAASETYKSLQGVLGETEQAVEAANHLAQLADNEKDLATWTDICTGVYATFGASLPIEGLTEAANETAKTGALTGGLADALNWAGVNEEAFQAKLDACSTEQERQALITETLNGLYSEAAEQYRETNAEIIRANEANEAWTASMADVGALVEPLLTDVKLLGASLVGDMLPGVQQLSESFSGLLAGDGVISRISDLTGMTEESVRELKALGEETGYTSEEFQELASILAEGDASMQSTITNLLSGSAGIGTALSGLLTSLLNKIVELAPTVAQTALSLITSLSMSLLSMVPQLLSTGFEIVMALVEGLTSAVPQIITQGAQILTNLGEGIAQNLPSMVSRALDALMSFATALYDNAPTLIEAGISLLGNLIQGIVDSLPILISKGPEIISKFANIINDNFPTILMKGVQLLGQLALGIIQAIPTLVANIPKIITAIVDVWEAFNWLNLGKKAITFLKDGVLKMVGAVKSAGTTVMDTITNAIKSLPDKLLNLGKNGVSKMAEAIRGALGSAKSAASSLLDTVVNGVKGLPSKMLSVGKDLVKGLANGISDMTGWVINKIKSFSDSILEGIKDFFDINSPSREMAWVGQMLDEGLVKGVEDYADEPLAAMADLSQGMLDEAEGLNGVTINRQLSHSFADSAAAQAENGILGKLDRILTAIEQGQVIALDGEALVGATLNTIDKKLGQQQLLTARGAF